MFHLDWWVRDCLPGDLPQNEELSVMVPPVSVYIWIVSLTLGTKDGFTGYTLHILCTTISGIRVLFSVKQKEKKHKEREKTGYK